MNIRERTSTLRAQQQQLIEGRRPAQMFPVNTKELPVPKGFQRVATSRGVFHFNPRLTSRDEVLQVSAEKRENLLLGLGPYNKADIIAKHREGEALFAITERTPEGVEVKAAAGSTTTLLTQIAVFEHSKSPGNVIAIEEPTTVLAKRMISGD